jgi:hypothetical protein
VPSTRVSRSLTSAKYRDPLNLDQHFRTCETGDGNQRTRRKIIAEDLLSQLSKAVTIAGVGDEHSHRDHISQGAAGFLECLTEPGKYLADLPVKIVGKRFVGRVCRATCPANQTILPPLSDDRL